MQEVKANLGRVVRTARKRKGITQDHLAEEVGIKRGQFWKSKMAEAILDLKIFLQ